MSSFPSLEYRSLKRKEHCPPDVYCQRSEQKEDLMCEDFVKDGFKYTKPVRDEYESCKEESRFLNSDAVWSFYYNVMLKKYECSNFQDFKKRQTTNIRDTVIPAIDMYKEQVCDWFRELSSNVPLQNLGRRVPFFKDKEELLHELLSNKVPITRALWFINISVIQSTAVAETAKKKPRAPQDPTADWSSTLCRLLSRSLEPIYAPVKHNELISLFNDWDYLFSLLLAMYDSDMADHWEVILWLIKVAESVNEQIRGQSSPSTVALSPSDRSALTSKCASDFPLKFILHYLIKFGRRFTESELLIRRLLYWCCTTFADVVFACTGSKYAPSVGTLQSILNEYKDLCTCPLHQNISMSLSSLIIFIVLSCPSAAVWNPIPFDTDYAYFKGSPLDHIPHSLVALPLPLGEESTSIRKCLSEVEEDIIRRSQLVESGWLIEPCSGNNGENIERLVRLLDILDRHEYHLVREPNPMESLYNRIFNDDSIHVDTAIIVMTLCEWAVSPYRIGIYRSIIVACLLEQLKNTFYGDNSINSSNIINKDTVSLSTAPVNTVSTTGSNVNGVMTTMTAVTTTATTTTTTTANTTSVKNTTNINNMNIMSSQAYQSLQETLIKFLDNCTAHLPPFNGEQSLIENNLMRNLVCLFSELIDREVFDHDNYVRYFIARGVFDTSLHPLALIDNTMQNKMNTNPLSINNNNTINQSVNTPTNITRTTTTTGGTNMSTASITCHSQTTAQHSVKSEFSEDMDRYSMDNPDSVRSESGIMNLMSLQSNNNQPINHQSFSSSSSLSNNQGITNSNRHLHYLVQFPIPQDESYAHEQNQRFQLLYGSVRSRDRARYPIRKLIRDICKLFTKKIYLIDVFHGELGRRKRSKDREREKDVNNNNNTANNNNNNNVNSNNLGTTLGLGSLVGQSTTSGTGTSNNGSNVIGNGSSHRSVSNNNSNDETRSIDEVHEDITKRFINLSFYDMEYVLSQCTPVFVKMLSGSNFHSTVNASNDDNNNNNNSNITSINTNSPLSSSSSSTNTQNTTTTTTNSSSSNSIVTTVSNNNNNPLSMTTSNTQSHIYMPVPSSIFLFFELIETSLNITSLILTIIDTLERLKILFENRTHFMTLYMSSLCLRSVGILQRYQNILFTMGDISCRLFPTLIEQVRQVKEPTQCGPLERCILIYLNDLFISNIIIKTRFTPIYGKAHQKVNALLRRIDPNDGIGQFDPDYANDLITITSMDNVTSFRVYADDLRNKPDSRYSFVCKAIIWICQAKTIEHVNYLCGLCAELTSQCSELTSEWLGAFYAILAPHSYVHGYSPLINTIDPSQIWIYDNLSSLIGTLLSRYCFTISDFLRLVICPAMAQGLDNVTQPVSVQLKSIISLACHILHCLFTAESTVSSLQTTSNVLTPNPDMNLSNTTTTTTTTTNTTDNLSNSPTSPPFRISEPLLLTAALQKVTSEFLVDVLKMLIVHSDKASVDNNNNNTGFCSQEDIIDETDNATGNDDNNEDSDANQDDDGDDEEHDDENDDNDGGGGGGTLNTQDNLDDLTDIDSEGDNYSILRNTTRKRTRTILQSHQKDNKSKRFKSRHNRRFTNRKSITKIHYIIQRYLEHDILPTTMELRTLPLNALTQLVLREICTISWVRERFYQMTSNQLIRENVLIDKNFTQSQARRLLHIIYWPYDITWIDIASTNEGLSGAMCHILHNLNIWTLKCTQIEFQLLYSQISFSQQTEVLGYLAQSIVHGFQSQIINWLDNNNNNTTVSMTTNNNNNNITTTTTSNNSNTTTATTNNSNYMNFQEGSIGHLIDDLPIIELDDNDPVWLFPALIAKLPKSLKAQIVKVTSEILKGIKNFWKHKNDEDKESILLHHSILLTHPTFFSLLQICLPDSDFIIESLYEQIEYFLLNSRHLIDHVPENLHTRQIIQNCLKYRLILIGQKFHIIQLDIDMTIRWITLLTQLISYGIIEPESNSILFYIVYDMLQLLIHTLTARTGIEGKHYQMIAKKLRRELLEHPCNTGIEYIRPLLLLTKNSYTIFVTGRQLRHHGLRGGLSNMNSGTLSTSSSSGGGSGGGGTGSSGSGSGIGSSGINNNNNSNKLSNSKGSGKAGNCLLTGASRFLTSSSSSSNSILQSSSVGQFKRHGYQLLGKERFNPWEIYDPSKQPLLLSIHGAINTESILSRIEEQANRLIRHDHFHRMYRPPEFYMIPIYPQTFDEDISMNHVKLSDVGEHDHPDMIKMIKTENSNNNNDTTTNSITNNTSISSIYSKNHNSNSMDVMRESQILSLNDMTQLSETNLSECSNQFLSINGSNNNNNNDINIRSGDSNSNYHQSTSGVLYDQKHNISSISCHSTNNLMFNESNSSIKSVNQIDCGNTNMMMSMMMMTTSSGSTTVDTATNNSNSMQIGRGKLLNTRNDIEINDKLSLNNRINAFQSSSSGSLGGGTVGSGIGVVSSSSSSLQIHSHPQQIHGHHHHHQQQQQIHLNSDQAYTNSTRKLPSQQTVLNDYSNPNELDQRPMSNVNHCVTLAGHMNTITYPLSHHHNHQMDVNLHKTNKLLGMEYNDRLIASQSSTSSQQQIQLNPTGTSSIPPPSNNATMLSTPMNNSVVAGHVLTSAKTATTTTKRKRGSGRRGGGGNITSDRNSIRPSGATTRGGMHTTGSVNVVGYERMNNNSTNNSSVNLYSYNIINPEQQVNESNHQWTNKQNVYNMNLLEMQQQQPPSSTRGHHQQQHLANLSGFLRNRAQQHHQQQQQQLHPEQSYGSSFNANNPVVLSHQGHVFDQSQLSSQFNQSNTHLVDSPSGSLRRHLTTSGGGAGNVARSMQQSSQQQSHQILSHPSGTPQQLPPGMPNPPPYPISNHQSQQYSFRAPPSDEANYMMNTNESSIDEQFKRQSINPVMNSIHQSGTTIMSRSSTYESPASHLQTDVPSQQQQQHMSYIPSQVDTPLNQSRIHSRIINQSQSNQMIRSDITPTTVINTGNNNQPSHMSNLPHSSYSRYTGY